MLWEITEYDYGHIVGWLGGKTEDVSDTSVHYPFSCLVVLTAL